jgi:hypothetical protein
VRLFRRNAAEPLAGPDPAARKSARRIRLLKRLLMWLAPFALDSILRRRKGRGLDGPADKK